MPSDLGKAMTGSGHSFAWWRAALLLSAAGCSQPGLAPVEGRVLLDGQPLTSGHVVLQPASDPLPGDEVPSGTIAADGVYRVTTGNRPGARPGAYRVVVVAQTSVQPAGAKPNPKNIYPAIDRKFFAPGTTPLRIDVTPAPAPGAYDLTVTR